jgi:AcrR family transcriptional regulator
MKAETARPLPQRDASDARRRAILDAAGRCFAANGFAGTSIENVRAAAGASVGSIYHHFGDKENLAAAVYVDGLARHHAAIRGGVEQARDSESRVKALVRMHFRWAFEHPELSRYLLSRQHPEVRLASQAQARRVNREYAAWVEGWLEQGRARGEVSDAPTEVMLAVLIGPCMELTKWWVEEGERPSASKIDALSESVWNALRGQPR